MRAWSAVVVVPVAVSAVLTLGACSSGNTPASSPPTPTTSGAGASTGTSTSASTTSTTASDTGSAMAAGAPDPCALLTDDEVKAAGGHAPTKKSKKSKSTMAPADEPTCSWYTGASTSVYLKLTIGAGAAKKRHAELKKSLFYADDIPGPAIGTGVFWLLAGPSRGPELVFLKGSALADVSGDNPKGGRLSKADEAGLRTKTEALGRAIAARLP